MALDNVSFKIRRGEIYCVYGPNGAGKTTLCKIACGLLYPTSGVLKILGYDSVKERKKIAKDIFAVLSDYVGMWDIFQYRVSVYNNLKLISKLWNISAKEFENRLRSVLKDLNLEDKMHEWYQRLSRGYRQILWIAATYIVNPEVLILDEPMVYLDPLLKKKAYFIISELIRRYKITILYTTHSINEIGRLCSRVMLLYKRVIFEGALNELKMLSINQGKNFFTKMV